jgi:hypothetical protein
MKTKQQKVQVADSNGASNRTLTIENLKNLLHEFWNHSSDMCPLEASIQEDQELKFKLFIQETYGNEQQ